ncbi:hypothetical protein TNCV_1657851 [Trichonephila clavipes]|nr:hypothetical protein TNCV_1657851 [Trichonephila clavipes]
MLSYELLPLWLTKTLQDWLVGLYQSMVYPRIVKRHCLQIVFRQDSSSNPQTDESHLVRDQDCKADGVSAPNQKLQYGFALLLPSEVSQCHPTTECQI